MFKLFEFWALVLGSILAILGGAISIKNRIKSDKEAKAFQDSLSQKSSKIEELQNEFIEYYKDFDKRITEKNEEIVSLQKQVLGIVDGEGIPALYVGFDETKNSLIYGISEDMGRNFVFEIRNNSNKEIRNVRVAFYDFFGRLVYRQKNMEKQLEGEDEFFIKTKAINLAPQKKVKIYECLLDKNYERLHSLAGPASVRVEWGGNNYYDVYYHLTTDSGAESAEWKVSGKHYFFKETSFTESEFFQKSFERK